MKITLYIIALFVLTIVLFYQFDMTILELKPIKEIDLSTLLISFPILLALVERFNELFVIKRINQVVPSVDANGDAPKKNFKNTTLTSFTIGLLIAIVGFRILETFMNPPSETVLFQNVAFRSLDCILTASIIAGGTDGWHQLVSLISDITKSKRKEIKEEVS
ncbi:hypothetical protein [Aquimarina sp. 2201CG14-23]|uniref:hypothetical protein n=1 Tax=Aquimarina mycalae TaxID=3040073 RepID=UPI002477F7FF|nr:hypothetical protein [Aquimarina sp. 2201CG14-23]MDH7444133.1 hypothetical protein [Aquimarina sp. 2201CG14-23]